MSQRIKICFVGGGSLAWAPRIVKDILLVDALSEAHIVLLDRDIEAAEKIRLFLDRLCPMLGVRPNIEATDRQDAALKNADYVIITISTGGFDAMAHDLSIPARFGIRQTVGDTCGPGGWARFIRNYDVFAGLGRDIARWAPNAVVLNYTNPMSTLTRVLALTCPDNPVVGLCHGLFENIRFLQRLYRIEREEDITARYGGLNHFFFMSEIRHGPRDLLADLRTRTERRSLTALRRIAYRDEMGFGSDREVATDLFRLTGWMPYLGDRHTCEFLSCYITDPAAMKKYRLRRTAVAERRARHRKLAAKMAKMIVHGIEDPSYLERSRETAADIIHAHSQHRGFIDVGNLPNTGQISSLPTGVVVETAVHVDGNGFTPLTFGPLPPVIQGLMYPVALAYEMVVEACRTGDRALALQALRIEPSCARLTGRQIERMGLSLLRAHADYITVFDKP